MSVRLLITFAAEQRELVLARLYEAEVYCFQEGTFAEDLGGISDQEIRCHFDTLDEATRVVETIDDLARCALDEVEDEDWQTRWKEFITPTEVSPRLRIRTTFHEASGLSGQQEIVIEPQLAFGTGSHPTTFLCLQLLDELFLDLNTAPMSVLDVGCGSGILAITADRLGATEVLGIDIEPDAIQVSAENAKRNAAECCQFAAYPLAEVAGSFDLVLANILSGTLSALLPELIRRTKDNGSLIVSGLLTEECDAWLARLPDSVRLIDRREHEAWAALHLVRVVAVAGAP